MLPEDVADRALAPAGSPDRVNLGNIALRGEKNVLNISAADLLRLRYNPFHEYMIQRAAETVSTMRR